MLFYKPYSRPSASSQFTQTIIKLATMKAVLLLIISLVALGCGDVPAFTSYVNLEKLITMEDELISIADAVVMQERAMHDGKDVHDLDQIRSVMEASQEIHSLVEASNYSLPTLLVHPVNIYHLVKRLVRGWADVAEALSESKLCMITMRSKIQNIADNIPTEDQLKEVCRSILKFQGIYNITVADVASGNIAEMTSLQPLSLNDAFLLARVAYESRDFNTAVDWLSFVISKYEKESAAFELTAVYNLQSSTLFMLERPKDALDMLDSILALDPENVSANRNRKFMLTKVEEAPTVKKSLARTKKGKLSNELCSGKYKMAAGQNPQQVCVYYKHRADGMFYKPSLKAEIFNIKPLIVLFHDIINQTEAKAIYYLAYELMRDALYMEMYQYPIGVDSIYLQDQTKWHWLTALTQKLDNIEISKQSPWTMDALVGMIAQGQHSIIVQIQQFNRYCSLTWEGSIVIYNIGMAGHTMKIPKDDQRLGTFITFLSEVRSGGEVVFKTSKTTVTPAKGSVLFYEKNNEATICPVLADTEWVGIYPLFGTNTQQVCPVQPVIRPKTR